MLCFLCVMIVLCCAVGWFAFVGYCWVFGLVFLACSVIVLWLDTDLVSIFVLLDWFLLALRFVGSLGCLVLVCYVL